MVLALLLIRIPLALDGESVNNNNTGLAAISVVSMVAGWLLIIGLWWFVFRAKAKGRRAERESERDGLE
jgi:hypothetical protein